MDTKVNNNLSKVALFSLFFVGNAVINLPFGENITGSLFGFILALLVSLPLILRFCTVSVTNRPVMSVIFSLYALFCGIVTLRNYVTFSDKIILPEISSFFPTLLFLALLWLICREKDSVLLKLSLVSTVLVFSVVILLFLFSLDNMSVKALIPERLPTIKEVGYQMLSYVAMSFIEGVVLIGFLKDKSKKTMMGGFLSGAAVLFIILIQCLAVFGYNLITELNYPYASAMSVITFGDKFSRMEGFSYLVYFSCTLIKTAVCVKAAKKTLCSVFPKITKYFMPSVLIIYGALSVFTDVFVNLPFMKVAPFLILPALLPAIMGNSKRPLTPDL